MSEISQLVVVLKKNLKSQGKTYCDVAASLELSEQSIKRMFASGQFTVERLIQISHFLGFTLAELAQEAVSTEMHLRMLSEAQEKELVSDTKLLLVAVCALNHWTLSDMLEAYRLTEAECVLCLLRLDRLRLISLLPGNRIRLNVSRDFDWIANGPINQYFSSKGRTDFLNSGFIQVDEAQTFLHGMLTESAILKMNAELKQLRRKFAELHEESLSAPLSKRRGNGLFLAMREWEPDEFAKLKKPKANAK